MLEAFDLIFNSLASLVLPPLPNGVGFWLHAFGVSSLIGGIITGIGAAIAVKVALFFSSAILRFL